MATEVKERSVPKPVFTDAEAGAKEFPSWQSRSYNYFEPRKRRATVYEDVTMDVQPDPARHLTQGWVYSFANGVAGYPQEWSALKSTNWHAFLDPNEEWEQTIYRNNAMSVAAAHKLRFAQDLILYNLTLSDEIDGFDGSIHKKTWQEDPAWQATRELTEQLTGIRDWSEQLFATTVVFEPLVGELFRSGFVMQVAAPHGDFVTPTIIGAGESDAAREQAGAKALFRMLADDPEHGEANKAVMQGWLEAYTPKAINAARNLQPIWSQLSEKVIKFEDSFDRSRGRFEEITGFLGLEAPKEVTA